MTQEKPWLMSDEDMAKEREAFIRDYITDGGGDIFNTPYGAGYWLAGIDFTEDRGWLAFEFDDDDDLDEIDHKAAIDAWTHLQPLPPKYFSIDREMGIRAFENGVQKWGREWYEQSDLPRLDELIQWTLLGEQRYG